MAKPKLGIWGTRAKTKNPGGGVFYGKQNPLAIDIAKRVAGKKK